MEDVLFGWKITGHYRYEGPRAEAPEVKTPEVKKPETNTRRQRARGRG
jgi:hypothetical protein